MKQLYLTKFLSEVVLNATTPPISAASYSDAWKIVDAQDFVIFSQDPDNSTNLLTEELKFVGAPQSMYKWIQGSNFAKQ